MKLFEIAQQLTPEQTNWLNKVVDGKWTYENGVVDVEGDIAFAFGDTDKLTSIPVQFGYVSRSFSCSHNKLTSLAGAPREVGGNFNCKNNNFKHAPDHSHIKIGEEFYWN